ncbi:MAG: TIGR00341 family protein, partial [Xanthomonadales bacterium]|nr:TIGR00341 family protein [Xanthomonadales bacterium]
MVIAPLLGPNVALALATTLGDVALVVKSLRSLAVGTILAFGFAVAGGIFVHVDPSVAEIHARTMINEFDLLLATAAGAAAALSFASGAPSALIGVMVAVALVPPLVAAGLQLGAGHFAPAGGALALFAINVLSVVLAGVASFALQGVRPRNWWEAKRARRAMWSAILSCVLLLAALLTVMSYLDDSDWSLPFNF